MFSPCVNFSVKSLYFPVVATVFNPLTSTFSVVPFVFTDIVPSAVPVATDLTPLLVKFVPVNVIPSLPVYVVSFADIVVPFIVMFSPCVNFSVKSLYFPVVATSANPDI